LSSHYIISMDGLRNRKKEAGKSIGMEEENEEIIEKYRQKHVMVEY